jgi:hypothetical protein
VLVVGGCSPLVLNDVFELDVATWQWKQIMHTIPEKVNSKIALTKHTADFVGGKLYLVGGGLLCFSFGIIFNETTVLNVGGSSVASATNTNTTAPKTAPKV